MRTVDHAAQLDRIDHEVQRNLRLLRVAAWLHRLGNAALALASVMIIVSTQELLHEPTPLGAVALIAELIVVEIDLLAHLVGHHLRSEVDDYAARLRQELEIKGDELRRNAPALGLDWQQFLPP